MFKKRLDYLAIPDGAKEWKKDRKKRAVKELENRWVDKVIILKGKDSEEDILYLGQLLKEGDRIGFDTFPLHYKEYKELIKRAKRDGKFPKGVKIENIKTRQPFKLWLYGLLGWEEERIKERKLAYVKNRDEKFLSRIKEFIKGFLS